MNTVPPAKQSHQQVIVAQVLTLLFQRVSLRLESTSKTFNLEIIWVKFVATAYTSGSQRTTFGTRFSLSPWWLVSNSDLQAWYQTPLSAEPSFQPPFFGFLLWPTVFKQGCLCNILPSCSTHYLDLKVCSHLFLKVPINGIKISPI